MTSTITLPAQTLTVLDAPTPLVEAVQHLDENGYYTAVVAIPKSHLMAEYERDFDEFYDTLCNALSANSDAFSISYQVLGVSPDGDTMYVAVENNLAGYLTDTPEVAAEHGIDPALYSRTTMATV